MATPAGPSGDAVPDSTVEPETRCGCGQLSPPEKDKDPLWTATNQSGAVHPESPSGGGGPGAFRGCQPLTTHTVSASDPFPDHPSSPRPLGHGEPLATTGAKPKPAPVVTADQSPVEILKENQNFVTIDLKYQIMKDVVDGSISSPGQTTLNDNWPDPVFEAPTPGKPGTMKWVGTIEIRTKYKFNEIEHPQDPTKKVATPDGFSCYGRGTTTQDRAKGDITLGFHESCHRADYASSLTSLVGFPLSPELTDQTTAQQFAEEKKTFMEAVTVWRQSIIKDSDKQTDEVGHKKSQVKDKKCFKHNPNEN